MRGLPQKQNARRAYKIRLCGHLRRYKKIVKKTYIISSNTYSNSSVGNVMDEWNNYLEEFKSNLVAEENFEILQEIE